MTVQDLVLATYEKAGNPTDLSPYNVTAEVETYTPGNTGWIKTVRLINRAYEMLAGWKLRGGQIIRFREHTQMVYFNVADYTPTRTIGSVSSSPADTFTYNATPFAALPSLEGWYMSIGTEAHTIISNTSSTVTFDQPWQLASTSIVGQTGTLFKRWFPISPPALPAWPSGQYIVATDTRRLVTPMKVLCLGSKDTTVSAGGPMTQDVPGAERTQPFYDFPQTRTFPSVWRLTDRGLEFENAPYNKTTYRVQFYCAPEQFDVSGTTNYTTVDGTIPNIPGRWHEILWQIAAWLRATQDKNDAETLADKQRIDDLINQTVLESERQWDVQDSYVYETV